MRPVIPLLLAAQALIAQSLPTTDYADYANLTCADGLLPTPTYGANGLFTICDERLINAPIQNIYNTLIDFRNYGRWNSFVVKVDMPANVTGPDNIQVGTNMVFTTSGILPVGNTTSKEIVTVLEPAVRGVAGLSDSESAGFAVNAWRFDDGAEGGLLGEEHPNLLRDLGNGSVRYVSYVTFYPPGGAVMLALRDRLGVLFRTQGEELKQFVEGLS